MKKSFFEFFKIIDGIYIISFLIRIPFLFFYDGIFVIDALRLAFFFLFSQIILLFGCAIFYFFTKNRLLIEEQIKYGLITLMLIYDVFYLKRTMDHTDHIAQLTFTFLFNILSVFYILKKEES